MFVLPFNVRWIEAPQRVQSFMWGVLFATFVPNAARGVVRSEGTPERSKKKDG